MGFITGIVSKLKPQLDYVEVNEDRQKSLENLNRLKQQLEQLINAVNDFPNIQYLRVEILKNYCKVPNFDIKLYDPILAHSVIHTPVKLTVSELQKFRTDTPVVNPHKKQFAGFPAIGALQFIDYPDFDMPDMPTEEPTASPIPTPEPTPEPTPTPTPTEPQLTDMNMYSPDVEPTPNPYPEQFPYPESEPESLPEPEQTPEDLPESIPSTAKIEFPHPVKPPVTTPDKDTVVPDSTIIWLPNPLDIEGVEFPEGSGHPVLTIEGNTIKTGWLNDNGGWVTFKEGQISISDTLDKIVLLMIMTGALIGGQVLGTVGKVIDNLGYIKDVGAVGFILPAVDIKSVFDIGQDFANSLIKGHQYDIVVTGIYNCAMAQQSDCEKAKRGMKLALIIAEIFPEELEVKENGMMYVNKNSKILINAVSGDIEKQPVFIPNYNCNWAEPLRFLLLKNSEMMKDDFKTVSPAELYTQLFHSDMKSDLSYWAERIISWK